MLPGCLRAIRDRVAGEGDRYLSRPGRVAGRVVGLFRFRVPLAQVFQNFSNNNGVIDNGDDTHGVVTLGAFKRVDFVDLLNEPGPVGVLFAIDWGLVQVPGSGVGTCVGIPLPTSPITVPAIIANEVFVSIGDVGQRADRVCPRAAQTDMDMILKKDQQLFQLDSRHLV